MSRFIEVKLPVFREDDETYFSRLFLRTRAKLGYTQLYMASNVGCSQSALSKIERGLVIPSADYLMRLILLCIPRKINDSELEHSRMRTRARLNKRARENLD
jgi:transcriptional regulator with XRE-family HTH domain